ncbi:hypothetical protein TcCL_NonESM07933, partial [Trypanosoma cruzi]
SSGVAVPFFGAAASSGVFSVVLPSSVSPCCAASGCCSDTPFAELRCSFSGSSSGFPSDSSFANTAGASSPPPVTLGSSVFLSGGDVGELWVSSPSSDVASDTSGSVSPSSGV